MQETLEWVRDRLETLVDRRWQDWSDVDAEEYADLCEAEKWLLRRAREAA